VAELSPGSYEHLITSGLRRRLESVSRDLLHQKRLEQGDAEEVLLRHLTALTRRDLQMAPELSKGDNALAAQVKVANDIAQAIESFVPTSAANDDLVTDEHAVLLASAYGRRSDGTITFPERPGVPLSTSPLLGNGRDRPQVGAEMHTPTPV
jgi:hypothetical protein